MLLQDSSTPLFVKKGRALQLEGHPGRRKAVTQPPHKKLNHHMGPQITKQTNVLGKTHVYILICILNCLF